MASGAGDTRREGLIAQAHALHREGQFFAALAALDAAGEEPDGGSPAPFLRATLLARVGRVEDAIRTQREALAQTDHPRARMALANMLRSAGDIAGAASEARTAIADAPDLGEAWWTLANLKVVPLGEDDRAAMLASLKRHEGTAFDRACLHFALAYAFEQAGEHGPAWHHLSAANSLRAEELAYRPEPVAALVDATCEAFTENFVAERAGCGEPCPAPIFIVGMPRAGSSLLERMLSAGGEVEALGELPVLAALGSSLGNGATGIDASYLGDLGGLSCADLGRLGAEYVGRAGLYRNTDLPRFSDKMPNNWLLTGIIALALPGAHVIDIRRDPLDCGVSNFRENFARGQAYSYDLAHIGAYYRAYVRMMDHFRLLLPGRVHRVIYERLIEKPELELRQLCTRIGVAYSPVMARPHESTAVTRTASAAQVRQPINRQGIGAWRRYADHLGPLTASLGSVATSWDA